MCIYMYVCIYIHIYIYTRIQVCMYVCINAYTHARTYQCKNRYATARYTGFMSHIDESWVLSQMCIYTYIYVYVHIYIYICTHTYKYVCVYKHIHTQTHTCTSARIGRQQLDTTESCLKCGVASTSRLFKIIDLFCKRAL